MTAPQIVSTGALITEEELVEIGVRFSELLDTESAEDAGNYSGDVQSAVLAGKGDRVLLEVDGLDTGEFVLTVNGVKDLAGNKLNDGKREGEFTGLQVLNIGDLAPEGEAHHFGEEIEVIAGGFDIWANADDFTRCRRSGFGYPKRSWARNGLMVRESLEDYSKMLGAFVTPPSGLTNQGYVALERREDSANCFWWNNNGTPGSRSNMG